MNDRPFLLYGAFYSDELRLLKHLTIPLKELRSNEDSKVAGLICYTDENDA